MLFDFFKSDAKLHLIIERDLFSDYKKPIAVHGKYEYKQITIYQYIIITTTIIKCRYFPQYFMNLAHSSFKNSYNEHYLDKLLVKKCLKRTDQRLIMEKIVLFMNSTLF